MPVLTLETTFLDAVLTAVTLPIEAVGSTTLILPLGIYLPVEVIVAVVPLKPVALLYVPVTSIVVPSVNCVIVLVPAGV